VDCNGDECKAEVNIEVDACGLQCPGLMMKLSESIKTMNYG